MKVRISSTDSNETLFSGYLPFAPLEGSDLVFDGERYKVISVTWFFTDGNISIEVVCVHQR